MVEVIDRGQRLETALAAGARAALSELPGVTLRDCNSGASWGRQQSDLGIDVVVNATVRGQDTLFLVEFKAYAYPRDVRDVVWRLKEVRDQLAAAPGTPNVIAMLVAPSISENSRELLRQHGIAYWDTSGSLSLDLPWAHYLIDRPAPKQPERSLRDVYQGSSAQVLHAVLLDPSHTWHLNELAERAEVAVSTAHKVCTFLERQLWMERAGKGPRSVRILREPGALLDAWAAVHSLERYQHVRFHRWARSRAELLNAVLPALAENDVEYALTLESGAALVAPYATPSDRAWLVVSSSALSQLDAVAAQAGLRRVDEGERVTFLVTHDRSSLLFRQQLDGVSVASDIQLYLDLWAWPMRGQEQARHLRQERLSY